MGTLDWSALRDGRITDSWRRQRLLCPDCQTETICIERVSGRRMEMGDRLVRQVSGDVDVPRAVVC